MNVVRYGDVSLKMNPLIRSDLEKLQVGSDYRTLKLIIMGGDCVHLARKQLGMEQLRRQDVGSKRNTLEDLTPGDLRAEPPSSPPPPPHRTPENFRQFSKDLMKIAQMHYSRVFSYKRI